MTLGRAQVLIGLAVLSVYLYLRDFSYGQGAHQSASVASAEVSQGKHSSRHLLDEDFLGLGESHINHDLHLASDVLHRSSSDMPKHPDVKVLYCTSWGMQRYFFELKQYLEHKYPSYQGNIYGDLYPPPRHAVLIATLVGYIWFLGVVVLLGGNYICSLLGIPEPPILKTIMENRMPLFIILFFANSMGNSMLSTGAFEVYLGDELIFSKLAERRFPNVQVSVRPCTDDSIYRRLLIADYAVFLVVTGYSPRLRPAWLSAPIWVGKVSSGLTPLYIMKYLKEFYRYDFKSRRHSGAGP